MGLINIIGKIKNILRPAMYGIVGSFIITAGWNWYHIKRRPHLKFVLISIAAWLVIYLAFIGGKKLFLWFGFFS